MTVSKDKYSVQVGVNNITIMINMDINMDIVSKYLLLKIKKKK